MAYRNYEEYLKSPEWREKAVQRIKIDGGTCQACGCHGTTQNPLQVHHLTYRRIYDEKYL